MNTSAAVTPHTGHSKSTGERTYWLSIGLLFFAGCSTALHMGKVPSALPLLRAQWELSLTQSGLILSIYSVLIGAGGLMLGILVRRVGYVKFAIVGVATVGIGSLFGAQAEALSWLLLGRAIEGLGWIVAVIALPSLLAALSRPVDRPLVMGIWGAFVPIGAGSMLLLAPSLQQLGGWRLSWWVAAGLSLAAAVLVIFVVRRHTDRLAPLGRDANPAQFSDLRKAVVWLLSGCFFMYSFQFIAVTSYLPTLFVETTNLSLASASTITALVIMANAVGNVVAGILMRRGLAHVPLLVVGALGMGLFALVIFTSAVSPTVRLLCAFGFSALGGLIPGVLFTTLPRAASSVSAVGLLIGLMMQLSGAGQLVGGILIPGAAETFGSWQAAGVVAFCAGVSGALMAWFTRGNRTLVMG